MMTHRDNGNVDPQKESSNVSPAGDNDEQRFRWKDDSIQFRLWEFWQKALHGTAGSYTTALMSETKKASLAAAVRGLWS